MIMDDKIENAMTYMKVVTKNAGREWFSPTEIGRNVGGPGKHSAYGSPICLEMVKRGLCERNSKGHYRPIEGEEQ